jgi:hypothetical protein
MNVRDAYTSIVRVLRLGAGGLQLCTVLLLLVAPAPAHAVTRKFCAIWSVDYLDGSTGDHLTDGTVIARGAKFRIHDNNTSSNTDVLADEGGADAGCVTADGLDGTHTYDIKLFAFATIGTNTVKITDATTHNVAIATLESGYDPDSGSPGTYYPGVSAYSNVMGAMSWALYDGTGWVDNEVLEVHVGAAANWFYRTGPTGPYIDIRDDDYKFLIVHELGHWVFSASGGFPNVQSDDSAAIDNCAEGYTNADHWMNSKEYQSIAAWEGVADLLRRVGDQ